METQKFVILLTQVGDCLVKLVTYLVPCVVVLLAVHAFTRVPSFVFRKLLHVVAFTCVTVMILVADNWQAAALASCVVAVGVYPILSMLEGMSWYDTLFVQKSPGETKRSLLMLFFMFAAVVSVAWGIFGKPELAAASILMWGTGDAAAALVGISFGRHKVEPPLSDGKKSWEGSAAMLAVSAACGFAALLYAGYPWVDALAPACAGAFVGAATELVSASEHDTVTVPVAILVVLLALRAI